VTLLDEIAGRRAERVRTAREQVARNLEHLCAIRRRALLLAPDYGVGEVSALFRSFPMIDAWAADLARTITVYERRLVRVEVVALDTDELDLALRAEIRGVLMVDGKPSSARFSARLDSHCRMSVR
jgi:type VI secretion system lysozyme-like protein